MFGIGQKIGVYRIIRLLGEGGMGAVYEVEPELDVVSFNGARTRVLVGEAKWSDAPFELAEVLRLAVAMKSRPIPAGFPVESVYVLFLASVSSDVPRDIEGVRIITAKEICSLSNAGPSAE